MHGDAMGGYGGVPGMLSREPERQRRARRWCILGVILIPLVQAFLWVQYASARQSGELLYAERYCGCRETVSRWVSDYIWTQMIWLPCNTLFLLIWAALALKLWNSRRTRR